MTIPKGAGAKVDVIAAKIIKKYGISRLDTISKSILKIVKKPKNFKASLIYNH